MSSRQRTPTEKARTWLSIKLAALALIALNPLHYFIGDRGWIWTGTKVVVAAFVALMLLNATLSWFVGDEEAVR